MNPDAPKPMQRRMVAGSSLADTTITGTLGYCARMYIRAGKPAHPGHRQIQQNEIDVAAAALEQLHHVVEGAGFGDIDLLQQTGDRLAQGAAEQRLVVGNHEAVGLG